jgi:Winged helix DNA-binding domain
MDFVKLRAWWFHRQALDGRLASGAIAETLNECGWARSVGGAGPYLGIFARTQASRASVDAAVANADIHELPGARGCTYVVAKQDFALALKAGHPFADGEMKVARKLGVTDAEIEKLCAAAVAALRKTPLDPDGLKDALGPKVRNLGEEGKKKGVTTTLPLALGRLQSSGQIRRIPVNGRLDQQRYKYVAWDPNPLAKSKLTEDETFVELARRYFHWIGPATTAEFQWFSALGVKAAKAAVDPLNLTDIGDGFLIDAALKPEFDSFKVPRSPRYAMVSSLDSILLLRRNLKTMIAEEDRQTLVQAERGRADVGSLADLPSHAILDRGRVIGLWEYDPETSSIAWATFSGKSDAALQKTVAVTEAYIRQDLGDARSFSLDSPKSRAPRIAALRGEKS